MVTVKLVAFLLWKYNFIISKKHKKGFTYYTTFIDKCQVKKKKSKAPGSEGFCS